MGTAAGDPPGEGGGWQSPSRGCRVLLRSGHSVEPAVRAELRGAAHGGRGCPRAAGAAGSPGGGMLSACRGAQATAGVSS